MQVSQLHGRSHLWLVGMVLLQVARQRAIVAATVGAVLPPAHCGTAGAANVNVNIVVDVGGRRSQGTRCLWSGCRRNRRWAGKG